MSSMVADLRALYKRERQLLASVESTEKFISNYSAERDQKQVNVRMEVLDAVYKNYFDIRAKIELQLENIDAEDKDADSKEEEHKERDRKNLEQLELFEDRYFALKAELVERKASPIVQPSVGEGSSTTTTNQEVTMSKVKLPEIRLPSFSGKIRDWVTFRDSFSSLIDKNQQLTDMDKFSYLRSSLSGEALQEIDSVEITAANYGVAWDALKTRYENRKLIVKAHLDALFSVEGLKKESYDGLNHLISEYEKNLQMLGKIGEKTENWSTVLAYMVCNRLDSSTLRNWETHHNSKEVPTYKNLIIFLRNHCSVLQSVAPSKPSSVEIRSSKPAVCHTLVKSSNRCPFCSEPWHSAFQCTKFQRMKVPERNEVVNRSKLCRNCLHPGHYARTCERGECRHCHQKHHSMLHGAPARSSVPLAQSYPQTQTPQPRQQQPKPPHPNQQTQTANTTTSANSQHLNTQTATANTSQSHNLVALPITQTQNILLSTALVKIQDRFGNFMLARALLDSCSQHCLMTKSFSNKLRFHEAPSYLSVQGIGSAQSVSTKAVTAVVSSRSSSISDFYEEMRFYVLPKLTVPLPTANINPAEWSLPEPTLLADPTFYESGPVDLIIGAEFYMDLLRNERQKATSNGPTLQNTVLGWIVSGPVPDISVPASQCLVNVCSVEEIQDQLTRFWELETCRTTTTNSTEESSCEEFFDNTTVRDEEGRYVVALPKKQQMLHRLGDSRFTAIKRLHGLERRFAGNPELQTKYAEFIHEYLELGHMKEVVGEVTEGKAYYLPHHAVLRPDSTTTKLRVVFDASCRTSTGVSLNDALMVGPVVQDDLLNIVLRFRLHKYALVADIAKMYRMVRVQQADQPLQRILWRDHPNEPIRTFELTTVTYGTASAPYLATKCLQRLAEEGEQTHPVAATVLRKDFYVDDMLSGVDDIAEGKVLIEQIVDLLQSAGFPLRKWNSNCKELLLNVPEHLRDERSILELDSTVKTLGLVWEPSSDQFKFCAPSWGASETVTKRSVLSDVSRLFDPLGLVGPVIIQAKIFIQELWKQECGWDDPLSNQLTELWQEFKRNLAGLEGLTVPRWIGLSSNVAAVQVHGFCDASEKAYGACIYLRTVSETGEVTIQLLMAKSRVAPLENLKKGKKQQSIPRLELSSALLLAHLFEKITESLHLNAASFFWTDSMIVKCWLSSPPSRWKQFVANRVSEIQHITKDGTWSHVPGTENPADIISRGMTPAQLQYQSLWFKGPHWLQLEEENWPCDNQSQEIDFEPSALEEKSVTATLFAASPSEIFSLRSSLSELVRLTMIIRRFCWNTTPANRNNRKLGVFSSQEREEALKHLVRLAQRESFPQEVADLSRGRPIRDSSRIVSLNPQLLDGILCVGGRLENANVSRSRKHPYIVDNNHPLARAIVIDYHRKLFHAGQQLLISALRERFWITSVRKLVRSVLHGCVDCFRARPKVQEQLMADLPPERVVPCFPFQRVGVDYCGPFLIRYPLRKGPPVKSFVAVYVCLVTKAVHLELATDLSSQAFLATLRRFVADHGIPQIVMCDNAKNFVGARREIAELHRLFRSRQFQNAVVRNAAEDLIEFKFIPARSPNFGGLWESAVKSFKTLFKRTIGTDILLHDNMLTTLAQIGAVLNSRPLTTLSNDPNDFEALTPGHFLIQRPLTAIPEPDLTGIPQNRLTTWQRLQQMVQIFWKTWSTQYLSDLHNRTKWTKKRNNITVGTMVILKEENLPPLKWQLARVTEVHAGRDGNVRVVTVRTKDGSYRRAISKICVLPIPDNQISPAEEN